MPAPTLPEADYAQGNLLVNGDFADEVNGWKREISDEGGSSKAKIIEWEHSRTGLALQMSQTGLGYLAYGQQVSVPNANLEFKASFDMFSTEGPVIGFSGSGYSIVGLEYFDAAGESLGITRILCINESLFAGSAFVGAPDKISDSNRQHNIMIEPESEVVNFNLNIADEINENLLVIDASQVRSIGVMLITGSTDKGAESRLEISDLVLRPVD